MKKDEERQLMVFASRVQLSAIKYCKVLVADATFSISPRPYTQVWAIHGLMEVGELGKSSAEWVPLAFSLMSDRTIDSYKSIAEALNEAWGKIPGYNVERIHIDFEGAEIRGLSDVFGTSKIFGCLTHYVRALIRFIQKECPNLFRIYVINRRGSIHRWVCCYIFCSFKLYIIVLR